MSIEVYQVRGDIMELIFDPREDNLRVGETLCVQEREGSGQGLICQIIEFRMVTYPALVQEQLRLVLDHVDSQDGVERAIEIVQSVQENLHLPGMELSQERNLKIAIAKIRKLVIGRGQRARWDQWDGWIPHRDVEVTRTRDRELFANCVENLGNPLELGETLRGEPFLVEGQGMEKINIVTGVKGSGKSHLSKVILIELIKRGAPCIVFDINKEYIHLPRHEMQSDGVVLQRGIVHLKAGENLKIGLQQFGIQPLITMLSKYGLPEVSAMHLENRLFGLFEQMRQLGDNGRKAPFLTLDHLVEMAENNEIATNEVSNAAIRSRLEAVRNTGIFASRSEDAINLKSEYSKVREGGALVIDVSALSPLARYGFAQAILDLIKEMCEAEIKNHTARFPFVLFEEAHLYVSKNTVTDVVTRSRHLGITCFFITNMVGGLDETVLRQTDNLFLAHLPFDDDVRHIGKSAMTDQETMSAFVKKLRRHHALIMGNVTRQYPIIIKVKALPGIRTAGETQYFFQPKSVAQLPPQNGRNGHNGSNGSNGAGPINLFET
jgi:hypothetical protein